MQEEAEASLPRVFAAELRAAIGINGIIDHTEVTLAQHRLLNFTDLFLKTVYAELTRWPLWDVAVISKL